MKKWQKMLMNFFPWLWLVLYLKPHLTWTKWNCTCKYWVNSTLHLFQCLSVMMNRAEGSKPETVYENTYINQWILIVLKTMPEQKVYLYDDRTKNYTWDWKFIFLHGFKNNFKTATNVDHSKCLKIDWFINKFTNIISINF